MVEPTDLREIGRRIGSMEFMTMMEEMNFTESDLNKEFTYYEKQCMGLFARIPSGRPGTT